jgi:hypothetical protein
MAIYCYNTCSFIFGSGHTSTGHVMQVWNPKLEVMVLYSCVGAVDTNILSNVLPENLKLLLFFHFFQLQLEE